MNAFFTVVVVVGAFLAWVGFADQPDDVHPYQFDVCGPAGVIIVVMGALGLLCVWLF